MARPDDGDPPPVLLPRFTTALNAAMGLVALAYAWVSYPRLPDEIPTHFGLGGLPDAWSPKSPGTVMLLPLVTLAVGIGMGLLSRFASRRAWTQVPTRARAAPGGRERYRRDITRFLCVTSLLATAMLALLAVDATRVGLGEIERLPRTESILAIAVLSWALGGAIYLTARYGLSTGRPRVGDR